MLFKVRTSRTKRIILGTLVAALLGTYIAAKIDTFTRLDLHHPGSFFRHHVYYWAAMVVVALLIWLFDKCLSVKPPKSSKS